MTASKDTVQRAHASTSHPLLLAALLVSAAMALAACGGGSKGRTPPSPPPPPVLQPGSLTLSAAAATIDESAGTTTITITRTGGSDGAVGVRLSSADVTATAGQDYTALDATVNFASGDAAAKTVTVAFTDDS